MIRACGSFGREGPAGWGRGVGVARGERGAALIEFALVLPPLLLILAIVIDLGLAYNLQLNALRGVAAGSVYAFENGGGVTSGNAADLRGRIAAVVQESAGSTRLTVTVLINNVAGSGAADAYYCTSGYPIQWTSTGASQATCADQTRSAKFVTIRTSATPNAVVPVASFGATLFPVNEAITVRLK